MSGRLLRSIFDDDDDPTDAEILSMLRCYLARVEAGDEGPPTGGEPWVDLRVRCEAIADLVRAQRDPCIRDDIQQSDRYLRWRFRLRLPRVAAARDRVRFAPVSP